MVEEAAQGAALAEAAAGEALPVYIARHLVRCDGMEYPAGSLFQHADPDIIAQLRERGAIALEIELQAAESVAQKQAALEAQVAALQAEKEALLAKLAGAQPGAKPGAAAAVAADGEKSAPAAAAASAASPASGAKASKSGASD